MATINPPTPPLIPNTPPIVLTTGLPPDVKTFISLSSNGLAKSYIKDSLNPIVSDILTVANVLQSGPGFDVNVSMRGIAGVSFDPSDFVLARNSSQDVTVLYDVTQLNPAVQEGTNIISAVFSLSSNDIIITVPPPPPPPIEFFTENRYHGSPINSTEAAVWASVPFLTQKVTSINYDDRTKTTSPVLGGGINTAVGQNTSVRWVGDFTFVAGTYDFIMTTDDGMRLKLDGVTLPGMDYFITQAPTVHETSGIVVSGGKHTITVEYFNGNGNSTAMVSWTLQTASTPTTPTTPITPVTPPQPNPPTPPATPNPTPPPTPTTPPIPSTPIPPTPQPPSTPVVPTPPITTSGGGGGIVTPTNPANPTLHPPKVQ